MKKFTLILFLLSAFAHLAFAQSKDPKAKAVLDGVSQKYASNKGLKASFEFSYSDVSDSRVQNQNGEIAIKGEKYHLKLPEQEIFNNGKTVWTYIVSDNYKEVTINNASDMENELTPSSVYNIYKKGYNYKLIGEKTENGVVIQEVELSSEKPNAPFKRVKLFVDKNKKDLISWEIYDDQGGIFKYKFKSVNTNAELADDYFTFNPQKYGRVEIIDLR
jgi:outer membrane lipoprotein-sorting protein